MKSLQYDTQTIQLTHPDEAICWQSKTADTKKESEGRRRIKKENRQRMMKTNLLTVILCELVEESASLLGLEISQHGGDDGADVF